MKIGSNHFYQYQNEVYDLNFDDAEEQERQQNLLNKQLENHKNSRFIPILPYEIVHEVSTAKNPPWIFSNEAVIIVAVMIVSTMVYFLRKQIQ